ncbi:hypothetical protein RHMOL_Rhmol08G0176800 [Rhododendron molle]|uniref:Uncharacterized protein n=1 Tax=Rhododendron molle TaxID=49168 RepID=A0ACC0MPC9_RHOML|nr:hypothetical protein RHMOL_Rhmol08G0176800 [Rhododendron molle]
MQCSKETLVRLFYNVSSSFLLLLLFFYFTSLLLAKLLHFCGTPILQRNQDGYEFAMFSEEEQEEESGHFCNEYKERGDHLVADIIHGGESLEFLPPNKNCPKVVSFGEDAESYFDPIYEDVDVDEDEFEDEILGKRDQNINDSISIGNSAENDCGGTRPLVQVQNKSDDLVTKFETHQGKSKNTKAKFEKARTEFTRDDKFLSFAPPKSEAKKIQAQGKDGIDYEEIFGDSCTVGSTSKSSSEWRSSINCRDSGTEDPFSSSSRRSCPKWESYTVFQKYDEEMLFLDRISAQKLHETESLRSIQACPRSVSERIVYKLSSTRKKSSTGTDRNPYNELEAAYVAQICLTWEALNWNYKYFQRLRASRRDSDPGCPAYIAQQFQQFQVLLQRYIENEPYDQHGRRPEIYARMRSVAPKLLQVPEYRDSIDEDKEESLGSRIPSDSFLLIIEESIRTFMNFLKADRESHYRRLAAFFRRNQRGFVDPIRLLLLKKLNKQKKLKLKDLRRTRNCLRRRRLKEEEEMEVLMALIDTKVVSRVMRMTDLTEEQLQWCDDKMRKVRVGDGKLQRDSSPLFFPAH